MHKQEFIDGYRLSDKVPDNEVRTAAEVNILTGVIDDFLYANFKGAYSMEKVITEDGYITVSMDYLAYFLRILLTDIYGRALLKIKAVSTAGKYQLEFSYGTIRLTEGEELELSRIAETAGFKVSFYNSRVFILAELSYITASSLYAIPPESLRGVFSFCFFGEHAREIERYNKDVKGLKL